MNFGARESEVAKFCFTMPDYLEMSHLRKKIFKNVYKILKKYFAKKFFYTKFFLVNCTEFLGEGN